MELTERELRVIEALRRQQAEVDSRTSDDTDFDTNEIHPGMTEETSQRAHRAIITALRKMGR